MTPVVVEGEAASPSVAVLMGACEPFREVATSRLQNQLTAWGTSAEQQNRSPTYDDPHQQAMGVVTC